MKLKLVQVIVPLVVGTVVVAQKECIGGFMGLSFQGHFGLLRCEVTLFGIAPLAGGYEVGPGMGPTAGAGNDVVQR